MLILVYLLRILDWLGGVDLKGGMSSSMWMVALKVIKTWLISVDFYVGIMASGFAVSLVSLVSRIICSLSG